MRTIVPALTVFAVLAAAAGLATGRAAPRVRAERVVFHEFDALWARAVEAGLAAASRKPLARWSMEPMGDAAAVTYCGNPVVVQFNGPAAERDLLFMKFVAVPHELAHVLNCLGPEGEGAKHGHYWEAAVYALVDVAQADAIIAQQRHTEGKDDVQLVTKAPR